MKRSLFILLVMVPLTLTAVQVCNASFAPSHGPSQSLHIVSFSMQEAEFSAHSAATVIKTIPPVSRSCGNADTSGKVSGPERKILSLEKAGMPDSGMKIAQKDEEEDEEEGEDEKEDEEEEVEGWDRTWDAPKLA
ncbi:hypothetical protein [Desulfomonile tiedjei]|uniref:Uncharacterized protein n=1 Tax=Desulfomonile tiedjei (strain ATCC 49306 / DSM 6799 / DCB-1) TaxID=706587 RepID=I4CDD4_DESTA|nr:hypothetical protein [Desulfomonile tiedjei]AFM27575.1 hypothetical protein Desti_4961 [Desulfomonile tiedjei DSM 6799]